MSEIYKRSMGQTFNEYALALELGDGTAGYDMAPDEVIVDDLSIYNSSDSNERQYALALAAERVDSSELSYEQVKMRFEELTVKASIADYVELLAVRLTEDYDRRRSEGQIVGDEYYVEAFDMAAEIAAANADLTPSEFTAAADALIQLQYAERRLVEDETQLMALAA